MKYSMMWSNEVKFMFMNPLSMPMSSDGGCMGSGSYNFSEFFEAYDESMNIEIEVT